MTQAPAASGSERRALQVAVGFACLVPLFAGGAGVFGGADFIPGENPLSRDFDSHFRYLSGLLLGVGILFLSCIPRIETATLRFQTLGIVVIVGGLARAYAATLQGLPSGGHMFGLAMELGVVPALMVWQANYAWRAKRRQEREALIPPPERPPS